MSNARKLRQWDLFAHFTEPQLDQLAPSISWQQLSAGDLVFGENTEGREAFFIHSGSVKIQRRTPYGLYTLASLQAGDMFGETSYVDHQTRSGEARVEDDSELLSFDPETLTTVCLETPSINVAFHWSIWKSLSSKLRETNIKLTQFFSEAGKPASTEPANRRDATGEFHIDLAAKRKLFQEQKLSNMEIHFLSSLSRELKVPPGRTIFEEGDEGDAMYVVLNGRVMISKYIPGAGEEALAFLDRGDYFGEMALIENRPRSAAAKTHDEGAVLLAIPREVIEGILDIKKVSSVRLLALLSKLLAKRLRELNEKLITWFIFSGGNTTEVSDGS